MRHLPFALIFLSFSLWAKEPLSDSLDALSKKCGTIIRTITPEELIIQSQLTGRYHHFFPVKGNGSQALGWRFPHRGLDGNPLYPLLSGEKFSVINERTLEFTLEEKHQYELRQKFANGPKLLGLGVNTEAGAGIAKGATGFLVEIPGRQTLDSYLTFEQASVADLRKYDQFMQKIVDAGYIPIDFHLKNIIRTSDGELHAVDGTLLPWTSENAAKMTSASYKRLLGNTIGNVTDSQAIGREGFVMRLKMRSDLSPSDQTYLNSQPIYYLKLKALLARPR
ncbi:MAG: hypothetical protein J0L93_10795 [Deltaproteobacteria bacterium]|nr:hypothetical protein [Deltaproteobacteria bacterium]